MGNLLASCVVATLLLAACAVGAAGTATRELSPDEPCPVTIPPDPGFTPPHEWAPVPPPLYDALWYGDAHLWTLLDRNGEVWTAWDDGHLPIKHFWFSTTFDWHEEPEPAIDLVFRRLGTSEEVEVPGPATHGIRPEGELHEFMLTGGTLTPGCWEVTATYRGATLTFVALLQPPAP